MDKPRMYTADEVDQAIQKALEDFASRLGLHESRDYGYGETDTCIKLTLESPDYRSAQTLGSVLISK